jgi:excisionase family DNA binding protein
MTTKQDESQKPLTVAEVAQRLRVSKGTVYKLVRTGVIPTVQLGGPGSSLRIDSAELQAWLVE